MSEDEWVKQALTDSTLAAKVLLRLFQPESPPSRSGSATSQALQLEWSVRQRRSKQSMKKKAERTRASPNTPLSWSGGVSVSGSGSGDGYEESSRPPSKPVDNARSKVATTNKITPKRSKRKKTLAELKEEMSLHLKENKSLKNELETVKLKFENIRTENERLSRKLKFEKERAINDSTKRMKFNHRSQPHPAIEPNDAISDVPQQREVACPTTSTAHNENELLTPDGCSEGKDMTSCNETSFELPDLNLPVEDGPGS
ncbi:hypothetical protein HRI_000912100 [Hibiscus trionum]|uniref:BZIP domain-containing protein n=1 Tax=Hibiscus trionum TaxID=183268 RepID=A0A9W7H8P2_HIBTR|nr:hypothetical protein HRI_000912100 [Hibiscus trionum]